jgi:hypothetical protein
MTRLFHVSDVHFGREDAAAVAWFDALVKAEKPDAVASSRRGSPGCRGLACR